MTQEQTDKLKTISYSGLFLSCFSDYSEKCIHATPEHVLVYLYSGEQLIEDRNEKIVLQAGDCAFIRRDHRLKMYKNSKGEELYKGISLTFKRNVLREFYSKMNKAEIPKNVPISEKNVFNFSNIIFLINLIIFGNYSPNNSVSIFKYFKSI